MKLVNHSILILSAVLLIAISLWSVLFYFQLLKQVKVTVDEGLANYKIVIIDHLVDQSPLAEREGFRENNYLLRKIDEEYALKVRDSYKDTLIYSALRDEYFQTRLLTTAFVASDGNFYELKVISQELEKGNLVRKIITSLFWLFLFMFVSTMVVNRFLLRKTWKPFYQLLDYLDRFRLDEEVVWETPETRIREFSLLNESIANLLKTNVDIYNSQKQFIENASHELQTPLAIGINKLEMLAEDPDLSREQLQQIGSTIDIFHRLSSLNKSLLLISKIENKQFFSEEKINFDTLFRKIIADFRDFAEYKEVTITYQKDGNWEYKMNKDLAAILLMNLMKNAIMHNHAHGKIVIRLSDTYFTIENTSNIPEMEKEKLFLRFHKTTESKGSNGLGLAIIKSIIEVSGLLITYSYSGNHIFKVAEKK